MSNFSNVAQELYIRSSLNGSDSSSVIEVSSSIGGVQEDGSAYGWPAPPFYAVIDNATSSQEVVNVTAKTGSGSTAEYTVTRGTSLLGDAHGSATLPHNDWSKIKPIWSAADAYEVSDFLDGGDTIVNANAASVPLTLNEAVGQTADAFAIRNSSDVKSFSVAAGGNTTLQKESPTLTLDSTSGPTNIILRSAAEAERVIRMYTGSNPRWYIKINGSPESGSDAGSNLEIERYGDSGVFLSTPLTINRATGVVNLESITVANSSTFTSTVAVGTPTTASHATTKTYVDSALANKLNLSGGALSGPLTSSSTASFTGTVSVGTPSANGHAATKLFVDTELATKMDKLGSSTDNAITRFDGSSGLIQDSGITVSDNRRIEIQDAAAIQADGALMVNVNDNAMIYLNSFGSTYLGRIRGWKSRGTATSPLAVQNGDDFLQVDGRGWTGSGYLNAGYISFGADSNGDIHAASMPGRIDFYTAPQDGIVAHRLRIDRNGRVVSMTPSEGFQVGSTGPRLVSGTGSPEGIVFAELGSIWTQTDHPTLGYCRWIKTTSAASATGWLPDFEGRWIAYTPAITNWTLGNGTVTGRYTRSGNTITMRARLTLGTTTTPNTSGGVQFSLPPSPDNTSPAWPANGGTHGVFTDSGSTYYDAYGAVLSTYITLYATGTNGVAGSVTASSPFVWSAGDFVDLYSTYSIGAAA